MNVYYLWLTLSFYWQLRSNIQMWIDIHIFVCYLSLALKTLVSMCIHQTAVVYQSTGVRKYGSQSHISSGRIRTPGTINQWNFYWSRQLAHSKTYQWVAYDNRKPKNIMKHTTRAIVSLHKQWFKFPRLIIQVSDFTIMIRWNTDILTIIRREMGQLETHSPMYSMKSTGRTASS